VCCASFQLIIQIFFLLRVEIVIYACSAVYMQGFYFIHHYLLHQKYNLNFTSDTGFSGPAQPTYTKSTDELILLHLN
jgi:hypothetical protein